MRCTSITELCVCPAVSSASTRKCTVGVVTVARLKVVVAVAVFGAGVPLGVTSANGVVASSR